MKKISFIFFMAALIICFSACGKMVEPIALPSADKITSIEVAGGVEDTIITDKEAIIAIIEKVSEAQPTSQKSVQDVPSVDEYTRIDMVSNGEISSIFVYQKDKNWYVELPYQGVYKTDEKTILLFKENFSQLQETELGDRRPMVMIGGKLYYDTGKLSTIIGRCGVIDGKITSTVNRTQSPTEDGQSNFGSGYEYQFVTENTVEILINEKWYVFEYSGEY